MSYLRHVASCYPSNRKTHLEVQTNAIVTRLYMVTNMYISIVHIDVNLGKEVDMLYLFHFAM